MGNNFFTLWDTNTTFKPDPMNSPLIELDRALTYEKNRIVSCDGTISYDSSTGTLAWDDTIRIHFNRADGYAIQNTIPAGSVVLSDNQFAYIDLSETDGQSVSCAAATITTSAASNFIAFNRFILGYRNADSDQFYPVGIRAVWGDASDSHARLHDIDSTDDHTGVSGATEDNLMSFDANGLPKDSGIAGSGVSSAVSASHARLHDIDSTDDHTGVSGATEDNLMSFDANGLPQDSGIATPLPIDIGGTYNGTFSASVVVCRLPMTRAVTFPASLTGSQGVLGTAATAQTDFDIQIDGVSFGTMRFAAAGTVATFIAASQQAFAAGEVLTVIAPGSPDATAADLGFVLAGTK